MIAMNHETNRFMEAIRRQEEEIKLLTFKLNVKEALVTQLEQDLDEGNERCAKLIEGLHDIQDWLYHSQSMHALQVIINRTLDN
jgi:hypothetical protein